LLFVGGQFRGYNIILNIDTEYYMNFNETTYLLMIVSLIEILMSFKCLYRISLPG